MQLNNKFDPFPKLITERLVLREVTKKDKQEIYFLRSDERMMTYVGRPRCQNADEALQFIQMIAEQQKRGESVTWAITLKDDPLLYGTICIWNIKKDHFRGELGYGLHPDLQGKGIMQEALKAVIDYGFNTMNLHSLEAQVSPDNTASLRVLERAGFIKEAYFKENFYFDGKFYDTVVYSKLKSSI